MAITAQKVCRLERMGVAEAEPCPSFVLVKVEGRIPKHRVRYQRQYNDNKPSPGDQGFDSMTRQPRQVAIVNNRQRRYVGEQEELKTLAEGIDGVHRPQCRAQRPGDVEHAHHQSVAAHVEAILPDDAIFVSR